ncbi:MAG: response regulator [Mariprofundaceae bacterium]|nr:response regulator [Mariprofundaceae bacterium]
MRLLSALHQKRDGKMQTAYHFSFFAVATLLMFTLFNIKYDFYIIAAVEMFTGTCWAALMVLHHQQVLPDTVVYHGMIILGFIILTTLLLRGGYGNAGIFWLLGFPFLAYFFAGTQGGSYWSAAFIASFIIIQNLAQHQLIQLSYDAATLDLIPAILIVFSILAYFYEKHRDEAMQNEHHALTSLQQEMLQHQEDEDALALSQARIKAMMTDMREAVFTLNLEGRITFISPAIQRITHFSQEHSLQQTFSQLFSYHVDQHQFHQAIHHYGQVRNFEVELNSAHQQRVFVAINARLTYDSKREVTGIEGIISDVTQVTQSASAMQLLIQELRKSRDLARASNQSKTDFLALISHELRTPIHGLMGMQEILMGNTHHFHPEQQQFLQASQQATLAISKLIHDITYMSQSQNKHHKQEDLQLPQFLYHTLRQQRQRILDKNLDFQLKLWDVPKHIQTDAEQLSQAVSNVLIEVIQHAIAGAVIVHARYHANHLQLDIHYSGKTMHLDAQSQDPQATQPYSHNRLEVLLIQHALHNLKAHIDIEKQTSEQLVKLHIPIHISHQEHDQAGISQHYKAHDLCQKKTPQNTKKDSTTQGNNTHLRILLAEDDKISRIVAEKRLKRAGFAITTVHDGLQAWQALQNEDFDVLLTDIRMPQLDGLDLTKRIRAAEEKSGRHLYILGLSAHVMPEDIETYLAMGMDALLNKPLQPSKLLQHIQHIEQNNIRSVPC